MQSSVHMDFNRRKLASQLCDAVNDGDPRCVQMLLSKGASPDLVGSKGVAAIHLAVGKETEKNIRCLKMLLQNGADPNIRSSEGLTPLHVAALWGCYQNLKLLLINGGNPNVKDNDGNTPGQLAEQQENLKCSHLLQEYQLSSADTEEEDLPQFQYSMYSDQADVSGYPESNYSFTSHSSRISDFSDVPLSSTRFSSVFNLSSTSGRPSWRGLSFNRPPGTSVLSSTRLSALEPAVNMSVLKEDPSCGERAKATEHAATSNGMISPSGGDCLPEFSSRQVRQKSVSFRNVDELFPVFSPESPKQNLGGEGYSSTLPFDLSEYSDFLDSERLATVFPKQGLDVTSPDHVYVFCRESSEDTEESLEKTIVSHVPSEVSDDELEGQNDKEPQVEPSEKKAHIASSSSGTGSSHYSSCESDHYTSCLDASQHRLFPSAGAESEDKNIISDQAEPRPETAEPLSGLLNKLTLSKEIPPKDPLKASLMDTLSKEEQETDVRSDATEMFTPSPFVTGRTRSRLSRCSMRTSRTHDSKLCTSSLFEDTLPTPIRMFRQTPRSSHTPDCTSEHSGRSKEGNSLPSDGQDTQSSPFGSASISNSQADTLILPKSVHGSVDQSGTLADTVLLDKTQDNSVDSYEKNLAEIILAVREQNKGIPEGKGFLTDDLTSADDSGDQLGTLADTIILEKTQDNSVDSYEKNLAEIILAVREQNKEVPEDEDVLTEDLTSTDEGNVNDASCEDLVDGLKNKDAWITEDSISQSDSGSSSSSSCYFSPRRSKESSDPPCTPGTGCTPRYSMSRLSSCRRPQRLADLSFTPGGRPLIQDLDEPVEYLYTDTEQGHKLIETHVPPTSDTSLSYSTNTTSSDETVLYDWRSLQAEMKSNKEKENQQPKEVTEEKNTNSDHWLLETRGITDKELRLRLVELGESPGPISSQTRPTYVKRLRYLLQESDSQQPKKQLNQQQAVNLGYSPELRWVLQTFQLPDCHADEQILSHQFDQPDQNRKWREGVIKSSFNYLLLDPRVTKNLPFRSHSMSPHECFQSFIHAIFYVGKGKRSRPYSHLYEALEYYRGEKTSTKLCPKVQHILQVWNAGLGVISLHCFQNVIPVEAYTREACMVEAMGLKMLTNQKRGDFYGTVSNWDLKRKRKLGVHLLYRAMQIFLAEGERQLRPADIRQ